VFNPFAEVAEDNPPDAELVEQAQHGSRAALEKLVRGISRGFTTSLSAWSFIRKTRTIMYSI
jgi:hypothetical protein